MATQVRQLSDGNPDGVLLGQSATDKVGFYGANPVPLRTGGLQAMVQPTVNGNVINFSANGGVLSQTAANTSANQVITATGMLATDFIVGVSRPNAHQANLGVGAAFLAAADGADVQFFTSNGAVTATANQQYSITALRGMNVISAALTPSAVVTKTASEQVFTVGGANGSATPHVNSQGMVDYYTIANQGNGQYAVPPTIDIDPDSANGYGGTGATAKAVVANGYLVGVIPTGFGTGYSNYANGAPAVTVRVNGGTIVVPGQVVVVSKAAYQANLVIGACRVVDVNKIAIPFGVVGAANITPTAAETYKILAFGGMTSQAPFIRIQATLANLTQAAANTSNKTAVTVVGIAATDKVVYAQPDTFASPLVYGGHGVASANTINIVYGGGVPGGTPANGVFQMGIMQTTQQPPVQIIPITVTSGAIAANTAAEAIATLPANITIQANTTVVVNPQQQLPTNILVVGARANSTTTIGINFMNVSTASITPAANQPFLAAVFPGPQLTISANQIEGYTSIRAHSAINQIADAQNELQQSLQLMGLLNGA